MINHSLSLTVTINITAQHITHKKLQDTAPHSQYYLR